jgi:hypothetical protein
LHERVGDLNTLIVSKQTQIFVEKSNWAKCHRGCFFRGKGFFLSVSKFIADIGRADLKKRKEKKNAVSHTRKFERPSRASAFRIPFSKQNEMARAQRINARV